MESVGDAASLFGSDDGSSDPFASIGTDEASQDNNSHQEAGYKYADSSQMVETGVGESFPATGNTYGSSNVGGAGEWEQSQVYGSAYGQYTTQSIGANDPYQNPSRGVYNQQSQWQGQQQYSSPPAHAYQSYGTPDYSSPAANFNDPYAPPAPTTPSLTQSHIAPQPTLTHSQSTYDPYKPSAPTLTNSYSTPTVPTSQSTSVYNPYNPSAAPQPPINASNANYAPYAGANALSAVPPPPKPASAAPYRPKTLDAYDPPMPPPKPKRGASRLARAESPAVGQQTYPVYDSFSPISPPVRGQYASPPPPSASQFNGHSSDPYSSPPQPSAGDYAPPSMYNNLSEVSNALSDAAPYQAGNLAYSNGYAPPSGQTYAPTNATHPDQTYASRPTQNYAPPPAHPYAPPNGGAYGPSSTSQTHMSSARQPPPAVPRPNSIPPPPAALGGQYVPHQTTLPAVPPPIAPHGQHGEQTPRPSLQRTFSVDEYNDREQSQSQNDIQPGDSYSQSAASPVLSERSHGPTSSVTNRATSPIKGSTGGPYSYGQSPYAPNAGNRSLSPNSVSSKRGSQDMSTKQKSGVRSPTLSNGSAHSPQALSPAKDPYSPPVTGHASYGSLTSPGNPRSSYEEFPSSSHSPGTNFYEPQNQAGIRATSPESTHSLDGSVRAIYDPHAPKLASHQPPAAPTSRRHDSQGVPSDPYAPSIYSSQTNNGPYQSVDSRDRSMSNGSTHSAASNRNPYDPYAPPAHIRQQSQTSEYGLYSPPNFGSPQFSAPDKSPIQEVLSAPTHAPYVPSPSLLGTNDPLGRAAARIPVFSFGFGGKVVTCFHGASSLNTGFDVALSARPSTDLQVRVLHKIIPESALENSTAVYPGPLFADPGTPTTTSLVRTSASQLKAKKAKVIKYLEERTEEISRGIAYLHTGTADKRQAEGKMVLIALLKVLVENDGRSSGTPQIDTAVRQALLPHLASDSGSSDAELQTPADLISAGYPGLSAPSSGFQESAISTTTLLPSAVDKIQEFLLRGERRKAYHFALDKHLWAHAMVIASSVDTEAWKEVVQDFLKTELGPKSDAQRTNGRESLKVAYSLFSGQGASAVQQLLPLNILAKPTLNGLQIPQPPSHLTPLSPNFPAPSVTANIPTESLAQWPETLAMMISSPMTPESSSAFTTLGDYLLANQWEEAAHACYLLSLQTSQFGGAKAPSVRMVLIGSRNPISWSSFHKDPDPVIFSEIAEFALSLATPTKGQEAFAGLPHLQAYKLIRASWLAEIGHVKLASRYCDAISASLGRPSPYIHNCFVSQLKGLADRLTAAPHLDKNSWMKGNLGKPSLDSIGNWIGGRVTSFIAGDADSAPSPTEDSAAQEKQAFVGPFSHYSTISSATTSASPSPQPTMINPHVHQPPNSVPRRSGSATFYGAPERASSAMDYNRAPGRQSPGPRILSAGAATTTFSQSQSFGQTFGGYTPSEYSPSSEMATPTQSNDHSNNQIQETSWWGSDSTAATPTASHFVTVDSTSTSSDGFISLMDDQQTIATPGSTLKNESYSQSYDDDNDDDLGLGNSRPASGAKQRGSVPSDTIQATATNETPATKPEAEAKPASSSSWISRWWKKDEATPAPIKASLGDDTSFYYDKDLKRWVNKKAGEDAPKPSTPLPPPSRAQTASPSRATGSLPPGFSNGPPPSGPPPTRPSSAIDITNSPPTKLTPRVRSNLVPSEFADTSSNSAPPTPAAGSSLNVPPQPPSRPRSQASKKNIRSRYVDVFQQPGAGAA